MNYTLHQLAIFCEIVKQKSITRAAQRLNLTQPAVSIQLRKLQDQLEIPLTEVIGRKLFITDFGEHIASVAKNILAESKKISEAAMQYKGVLAGELSFSIVSTAKYVLPYFLNEFMLEYKGVDVKIDVTNKQQVVRILNENLTDFAMVSVLPEDLGLNVVPLMPNELVCVCSSKFEGVDNFTIKDLQETPLIFREQGSATRKAMEYYLRKNEIKPNKRIELVSNEAVKQAVNAGMGMSIMPMIGLRNEIKQGDLRIIPLKGLPIRTQWYIVSVKGKHLSPAAQAYLAFLEGNKERLILENFKSLS